MKLLLYSYYSTCHLGHRFSSLSVMPLVLSFALVLDLFGAYTLQKGNKKTFKNNKLLYLFLKVEMISTSIASLLSIPFYLCASRRLISSISNSPFCDLHVNIIGGQIILILYNFASFLDITLLCIYIAWHYSKRKWRNSTRSCSNIHFSLGKYHFWVNG